MKNESVGNAKLLNGDCLEILPWLDVQVDATVTDPPYCSGGTFQGERTRSTIDKYLSSGHRSIYPDFPGDSKDQRSFLIWCSLWLSRCFALTKPGGLAIVFSDWRQLPTMTDAFQIAGYIWRGIGVWDKTEAARPQKGRFRNQAEYFVWGTNGPVPNSGPCLPGVFRKSVFTEKKHHVAGKPVSLIEDLLVLTGETILDPFMGSGTTGIACLQKNKKFVGIEISPEIYETASRRIRETYSNLQGTTN